MIAFDKIALEDTFLWEEAKNLKTKGFISAEELVSISKRVTLLKSQHNILVRLGLFLLGIILYSSIMGAISLVFMSSLDTSYKIMIFIYAVVGFVGCEVLTKLNYWGFGLDDAFILGAQGSLIAAIGTTTESFLMVFIAMTIVGIICSLRYINTLSTLICCVGLTGVLSNLIIEHKLINMAFLPFIMFFLAIGIYAFFVKLKDNPVAYFYKYCLRMVQIFSLILGYLSVNYLVVRQLSEELMGVVIKGNDDIPFAFLFYGLTFIIPIFYIAYSLSSKDRIMLLIGFLTLGFSFFTIRYYYSIMPVEIALILGGVLLFGLAYWAILTLKNKETGVTFKPDRGNDNDSLLNVQALIINSQVDLKPMEQAGQDMPFGGGGFSGGGSGGSF